jgi:hypothetical protein
MKRHFLAFFFIALITEVGTTWLRQFRSKGILGSGLYSPDIGTLLLDRLLIWFVLYLLLSALWLLLSRSYRNA